jgi:hypothetical protein
VLPFTKRPQRRHDVVDTLSSGDIEVVHASIANQVLRRTPEAARVFERSIPDEGEEDRTLLMSSKTKSSPPPAQQERATTAIRKPVPPPSLKGMVRRRLDTEDHTFLRPKSAMAVETIVPKPKTPAMMPTPYMAIKPRQLPVAAAVNAKRLDDAKPEPTTDPRFEVPAAVITQRTRIQPPKRSLSWGAALVGLGIAAGLVSAIVARGDADSLLDATARFVDPSGAHAAGATPQTIAPVAMIPAALTATPTPACGSDTAHPFSSTPLMMGAQPVAIAPPPKLPDPSLAKPEPPRPAPVAWAAPPKTHPHVYASQPAPQAAAPQSTPAAAAPAPHPAQVAMSKPAPTPKSAPAPKGNEMESASAADALAKAQLEASLR